MNTVGVKVLAPIRTLAVGSRPYLRRQGEFVKSKTFRSVVSRNICSRVKAAAMYDIAVKGNPEDGTLADCPFCHRALLTLEEKKVPYTMTMIDFNNKPEWLLELNPSGTVPVMKDVSSGEWTVDSGVIADMVQDRFADVGPNLGHVDDPPQVGMGVLAAFKTYAKAESEEENAQTLEELKKVLGELNAWLADKDYIGGVEPCATDLAVMPRLYHMEIALDHFKGWTLPVEEYPNVRRYIDLFMTRESWKNTYYSPELVIKGWERHGLKVQK